MTSSSMGGDPLTRLLDRGQAFARGLHRETWLAAAVVLIAALLRFNNLALPADTYDEGVYVLSLRLMAHGAALYQQVPSGQPPLFLLGLSPWFRLGGETVFAARLGIVAWSLVGLGATWWIGRALGGPRTALVFTTLLAFDPNFLAQSRTVAAEVPALALALVGLAAAIWSAHTPHRGLWLLAGAATLASIATKLATLPAIIPVLGFALAPQLTALLHALQDRHWPARSVWGDLWNTGHATLRWLGLGAAVVVIFTLGPFLGSLPALWSQVFGLHIAAESALGMQRAGNLGLFLGTWWELPLFALGLFAAGIAVRDGFAYHRPIAVPVPERATKPGEAAGSVGGRIAATLAAPLFALWGVLTLVALLVQAPLFMHHLVLLAPPFALAAGCLALPALLSPQRLSRLTPTARGGLVAVILVLGVITSVVQLTDQRNHPPTGILIAALDMNNLTAPGDLVITDDQIVAVLADRDTPPALADTSLVRIAAGQVTTAMVTEAAKDPHVTAILWYSGRFDHLIGLRAWVEARFIRVVNYGAGRGLYLRASPSLPVGLRGSAAG